MNIADFKPVFTLEELHARLILEGLGGSEGVFEDRPHPVYPYRRAFRLTLGGELRATWESRLVNAPVFDGKTPRGPAEYYDLRFYPEKGTT